MVKICTAAACCTYPTASVPSPILATWAGSYESRILSVYAVDRGIRGRAALYRPHVGGGISGIPYRGAGKPFGKIP